MKGHYKTVTIKDLVEGYYEDPEGKVQGYGGKLEIRPAYQREYIHENNPVFKENLIQSIYNQRPINLIYWALNDDDDGYELLDGQQRIITICRYVKTKEFSTKIDGRTAYYSNLSDNERAKIDDYKLSIYVCEGEATEKMKWFQTINTGAEKLSDQELRNAIYNGSWVTDAKRYFTKRGNQATMCSRYMSGKRERQEHLQEIIIWKIGSKQDKDICKFMANREKDPDAVPLWEYFQEVADWIDLLFPKNVTVREKAEWGRLHREYAGNDYDPAHTKKRFGELFDDYEVTKKVGIYEYILSGEHDESKLNLRKFPDDLKKKIHKEQGEVCKYCKKVITLADAHADHIKPWSKGGKTEEKNCQVLCVTCNLKKGAKAA